MASETPVTFPEGSIIVREKFANADDAKPELMAVMIKRSRGFSRVSGDWEYLIVDGALTRVRERQKKGTCNGCHSQQKDRDFVFPMR